jgi:hypothetical protein
MEIGEIENIPMKGNPKNLGISAALRELRPGQSRLFTSVNRASLANTCQGIFGKGKSAIRKEGDGFRVYAL